MGHSIQTVLYAAERDSTAFAKAVHDAGGLADAREHGEEMLRSLKRILADFRRLGKKSGVKLPIAPPKEGAVFGQIESLLLALGDTAAALAEKPDAIDAGALETAVRHLELVRDLFAARMRFAAGRDGDYQSDKEFEAEFFSGKLR
jgi:hypothetical protein